MQYKGCGTGEGVGDATTVRTAVAVSLAVPTGRSFAVPTSGSSAVPTGRSLGTPLPFAVGPTNSVIDTNRRNPCVRCFLRKVGLLNTGLLNTGLRDTGRQIDRPTAFGRSARLILVNHTYHCRACDATFRAIRKRCFTCGTSGEWTDRTRCVDCDSTLFDSAHQRCRSCSSTDVERVRGATSSDGQTH